MSKRLFLRTMELVLAIILIVLAWQYVDFIRIKPFWGSASLILWTVGVPMAIMKNRAMHHIRGE